MIGLDVFKEYFGDYAEQYILIGGAAPGHALAGTEQCELSEPYERVHASE